MEYSAKVLSPKQGKIEKQEWKTEAKQATDIIILQAKERFDFTGYFTDHWNTIFC